MSEIVAIDIGGTHARFAIAQVDGRRVRSIGAAVKLQTANHASLLTAWEHFAREAGRDLPRAAALAIAGPVGNDIIRFTNNPWTIRRSDLGAQLGVDRVTIINDFGAIAHAVGQAGDDDFLTLTGPDIALPRSGTISVVGPGTGLGVAFLWRDGTDYHVQATEGGHVDFAPLDTIEDRLLSRLRTKHRRVSVERVVSGPAIVDIYETLAVIEGRAVQHLDDRTIWHNGMSGADSLAVAAVERFCLSLGSVAGDIALVQGSAGVVIAGGLGQRLCDILLRSGFAERFRAKGRFESLMAALPVKLITCPEPGLLGAAAAFAREHS